MDDIAFLRSNLPGFESYEDEIGRHHTDQRIRAWVGSSLADVEVRLNDALTPEVREVLEATILRCQFPDQKFVTRMDVAVVDEQLEESIAACDRKLFELSQEACHADVAQLAEILAGLNATYDRRSRQAPVPAS